MQGLVEGGFGDERFAGAGGGADEHAGVVLEVGEEGLLLHRVRLERELIEVLEAEILAGGGVAFRHAGSIRPRGARCQRARDPRRGVAGAGGTLAACLYGYSPGMPDDAFAALRLQMPVVDRYAYFDHAAVAPLPAPAAAAMSDYAADFRDHGDVHWPKWRAKIEDCRRGLATLLNADEEEVAVIRNTTEAIGLVAEGIDWREGDNVVVPASEFPSNLLPWRNLASRGVEMREVKAPDERLDLAAVRDACDGRTRLIAASWVGYATGWRNDPADLCQIAHDAGALFLLDAIQGLGVLPLDVKEVPIDFLAADGHKWLLGPEGAGVLFIRGDRLADLRPLLVGWNSVAEAGNYGASTLTLKETAARYEGGTYATACAAGLAASLELLGPIPVAERGERLQSLTDRLVEGLRSAGCDIASDRAPGRGSGIVAFAPPDGDSAGCAKRLLNEGIVVRVRHGRVRAAPHVYTSEEEVERLVAGIRR